MKFSALVPSHRYAAQLLGGNNASARSILNENISIAACVSWADLFDWIETGYAVLRKQSEILEFMAAKQSAFREHRSLIGAESNHHAYQMALAAEFGRIIQARSTGREKTDV